jgi:putative tryptophan/tyrosine transport system substrate-binding protein
LRLRGFCPQPLPQSEHLFSASAGAFDSSNAAVLAALGQTGNVLGRNFTFEGHFLEGQYDRAPAVMADLVRRRVAVIVANPPAIAIAAKAATVTIPIVFAVTQDPVKLGLVASLARPGGNATGINFFPQELNGKRLELLHKLLPKAVRVAVLINPANVTSAETALRDVPEAALGEIDAAFATIARERPDALFVAPDVFFNSRRV